ncbi:PBECR2 nuclease fold domain-containing protein [Pseudomonas soli]|uniref:PBECR2 nuclease fold domain-containing protein n=1 Tax=Pseudomonas soli TaxID=1306993 RepID=UPI003822CCDD
MSPYSASPKITEKKGQSTWLDLQLPDLRTLDRAWRAPTVEELIAADNHHVAVDLVAYHLGLNTSSMDSRGIDTPLGVVQIRHNFIAHIVEKRQDARERFARVALDTLTGPFEVWRVAYSNDTHRLAFIGAYESKRQMLVIVTLEQGKLLWNFMQCDAKALNKHRHGELLYQRYELLPGKEKGHCEQWP